MSNYGGNPGGNGAGNGPGLGAQVDQIGRDAQTLWNDARSAVHDLGDRVDLRGRVQRNPYGTLLAAAGIGYILGGGLFTPLTARIIRFGLRLAAIPLVKDELLSMAHGAMDSFVQGARERDVNTGTPPTGGA